jgi:hypothetical protein
LDLFRFWLDVLHFTGRVYAFFDDYSSTLKITAANNNGERKFLSSTKSITLSLTLLHIGNTQLLRPLAGNCPMARIRSVDGDPVPDFTALNRKRLCILVRGRQSAQEKAVTG